MKNKVNDAFDQLALICKKYAVDRFIYLGYVFMAFFVISQTFSLSQNLIATGQAGLLTGYMGICATIFMDNKRSRIGKVMTVLGLPVFLIVFTFIFVAVK